MTARTAATFDPPISEAAGWLDGVIFPPDRPLLNLAQAAPADPPPEPLRRAMAEIILNDPATHLYGPDLGLPALRAEVARQWSARYGGTIAPEQVAITSGCNQAFAAAIASLCGEGDEVILPTPWYFNHAMWLDMSGVRTVPLATGDSLIPDPATAEGLITARTRAIALVSPNNPGGVSYPASVLQAFHDLCRAHGIALILDETYRDFDAQDGRPHDLFTRPEWDDTLIHLYSFSKAYRLTGHRVGAVLTSQARLAEVEKFIDTVTICPSQIGQRAALWGLQNLGEWVAGERAELLARRDAIFDGFPALDPVGWHLRGCGAYFAYVTHPFGATATEIARDLVRRAGVLMLPGSMFRPMGDPASAQEFRIAFANVDRDGIGTLFERLAAYRPA